MSSILFATYADKEYIPYLQVCIKGCRGFFGQIPTVFALDIETYDFSRKQSWPTELMVYEGKSKHILSLKILRQAKSDYLILIDADCWPLRKLPLDSLVNRLDRSKFSGLGDVGVIDIPYLFDNIYGSKLFDRVHETFQVFPNFARKWISADVIIPTRFSSGCVVDLPLLYGGFAVYKTASFKKMTFPEWINSADIWLSIFAIENRLEFLDIGEFQFNREIDKKFKFFHLSGPKPSSRKLKSYINQYELFLDSNNDSL